MMNLLHSLRYLTVHARGHLECLNMISFSAFRGKESLLIYVPVNDTFPFSATSEITTPPLFYWSAQTHYVY